jgi:hypothetical protein
MKYSALFVIIILWLITILASFILLRGTEYFTKLSGVYFICLLGSIITVRSLIQKSNNNDRKEN